MQVEFEKAMQQAETIDEALSVALDMARDEILSSEDFSGKNIDAVVGAMEGERDRGEGHGREGLRGY